MIKCLRPISTQGAESAVKSAMILFVKNHLVDKHNFSSFKADWLCIMATFFSFFFFFYLLFFYVSDFLCCSQGEIRLRGEVEDENNTTRRLRSEDGVRQVSFLPPWYGERENDQVFIGIQIGLRAECIRVLFFKMTEVFI